MAAALCCVFVSWSATAQEEGDSAVLHFTLEEAMSYALEHNWDLQNSSLAVRQAEADRWGAIATMLPQVNGTLDYSNYMGYEMDLEPRS